MLNGWETGLEAAVIRAGAGITFKVPTAGIQKQEGQLDIQTLGDRFPGGPEEMAQERSRRETGQSEPTGLGGMKLFISRSRPALVTQSVVIDPHRAQITVSNIDREVFLDVEIEKEHMEDAVRVEIFGGKHDSGYPTVDNPPSATVALDVHPLNPNLGELSAKQEQWLSIAEKQEESVDGEPVSALGHAKRRDPDLEQAVQNFENIPEIKGDPELRRFNREVAQVSFRVPGYSRLVAGKPVIGQDYHVQPGAQVNHPWAATVGHTHPYVPGFTDRSPSVPDHKFARKHGNLRHYLKVPTVSNDPTAGIQQFTGAIPFRHSPSKSDESMEIARPDSPDLI